MDYRQCAVLVLMSAGVCNVVMAEAGVSTALELGYRVDNLSWNIASDTTGQTTPNVLSELSWSNLVIPQARFKFEGHGDNEVHLFGSVAYGRMRSGDNQDSDYILDNRQGEFSRSNNRAGGNVADGSLGVGVTLLKSSDDGRIMSLMPIAGYSLHRQNLTMTDGNQTIDMLNDPPNLGTIPGLDSSYDARWQGGWLGFRLMEDDVPRGLRVGFDIAYHKIQYRAEANWNLRTSFAHPKSFDHHAEGNGWTASLNAAARLTSNLDWLIGLDYGAWIASNGVDTVYPSDSTLLPQATRLNEVSWESLAINMGLALRF